MSVRLYDCPTFVVLPYHVPWAPHLKSGGPQKILGEPRGAPNDTPGRGGPCARCRTGTKASPPLLWRLLSFPLTLSSTVQSIFSTILSSTTTEFTTITETILITWSENYLTSAISENTSNSPNRNIQEVFRLISLDFGTIPNSEYRTESLAIDLMSREFPNRWHSYIPNRWHSYIPNRWHSYTVRFRTYSWRPLLIHLNVQQVRTCFSVLTEKLLKERHCKYVYECFGML